MKKIAKKIIAIACSALMLVGMTACGDSAYEIAVKNGFVGTEQEWLASLHGANGEDGTDLTAQDLYQAALENGYAGSFIEFCRDVLKVEVKEDNDADQIAKNITSVVSVYCRFSKTTSGGLSGIFGNTQTEYYSSAGSGVILELNKEAGNALIVTNYHVIYDAESDRGGISDQVYLYAYGAFNGFHTTPSDDITTDGRMRARYIGGAMDYDIALLAVEGSDIIKSGFYSKASVASSDEVSVGEKVFAIGNPDGAGIAVTEGVISVESEYITMASTDGTNRTVDYRVMRTDAAINGGNSGGALFNSDGELIGITNAKNVSSEVDNMGYALPTTQVKNLCQNILNNGDGTVRVATLGVMVGITASQPYYDTEGKLKIRETFSIVETARLGASSYGKFAVGDSFKAIKINDGEWIELTRRYQVNDTLLSVKKGDTVQFRVVDSNGMEKIVEIRFDRDSYFTKYE
jgi:serine protease Do